MQYIHIKYLVLLFYFINSSVLASNCTKPKMPSVSKWNEWLNEVKLEALSKGISIKTLENELSNIKPQSKINDLLYRI